MKWFWLIAIFVIVDLIFGAVYGAVTQKSWPKKRSKIRLVTSREG